MKILAVWLYIQPQGIIAHSLETEVLYTSLICPNSLRNQVSLICCLNFEYIGKHFSVLLYKNTVETIHLMKLTRIVERFQTYHTICAFVKNPVIFLPYFKNIIFQSVPAKIRFSNLHNLPNIHSTVLFYSSMLPTASLASI